MKDTVATLLNFLFAEDKKAHPMPPQAAQALVQKFKEWINKKEVE